MRNTTLHGLNMSALAVTAMAIAPAAPAATPQDNWVIRAKDAPAAIGPYSQAIWAGDTLYVSGQLGIDTLTGALVGNHADKQTRAALENIKSILREAGLTMANIVSTTIYLADIEDYAAVNEIYATYFTGVAPARSAISVAGLPKKARVEISVIALRR